MNSTKIKKEEVLKELGEWFAKPNCKESYFENRITDINNFLEKRTNPKSSSLPFENLNSWYGNNFVYKGLKDNDTSDQIRLATNGYFILELTSIIAKQFPNNPPFLSLQEVASYLANAIIQKWSNEANKMLKWILEGLDTKFLKGGQKFSVAAWFIISVACKGFNKKLETEKYNYPTEMGIYQEVIDKWNIEDTNEVDGMVSKLCDYHLEQADFDEKKVFQFSFINEFVYAYEILAWLALREINGLSNPEIYTHPLMQLPVNRLPKTTTSYQPTELYEQVLARVKEDFKA